jgi:hypothetical protein
MVMFNRRRLVFLLPFVLLPVSACAVVLGIEDRELVTTTEVSCDRYCDAAMTNCTAEFALYASRDSCIATCAQLDLGKADDKDVNTVGCRLRNAELAGKTGEKSEYCVNAGPGGNAVCGSDCEAYCKIMQTVCAGEFATDMECMTDCAPLPDNGDYNIAVPNENSIECRLYHVSAATIDNSHCPHAAGVIRCVEQTDGGADGG